MYCYEKKNILILIECHYKSRKKTKETLGVF